MADAIGRFHWLVIDTVDPVGIAPFWCELLGVTERGWFGDDYLMLERDDHTPGIAFQRVPEAKAGKNRLHVDVDVADVDAAVARILELGGTIASEPRELDGYRWRVMTDPEGNEFCVVPRDDGSS